MFKKSLSLVASEVKSAIIGLSVICPIFSARLVAPTINSLIPAARLLLRASFLVKASLEAAADLAAASANIEVSLDKSLRAAETTLI